MFKLELFNRIRDSVNRNFVAETFKVCGFPFLNRSPGFLSKHAVGNGRYSKYFIREGRGLYRLK